MRELVFTVNDWKVYQTSIGYDIQNYSRRIFLRWNRSTGRYTDSRVPKTIDRFIRNREHLGDTRIEFHRTFGVEIECYHTDNSDIRECISRKLEQEGILASAESYNHNTRSYWKITTDSSINGGCGAEVVSPILQGESGLEELRKVMKVLSDLGCRVNRSTGLHVHIGADDLTSTQLRNIIDGYRYNESLFDKLVANSRRENNNQYCHSLRNYRSIGFESNRYYKVNYQSYLKYGTLEFRQHQGTLNGEKAENWIRLVESVVNHFANNPESYRNLESMVKDLVPEKINWYLERAEELAS